MSDKTSRQDLLAFDEAAFMRRVPHAQQRLNVHGAYIARVPPGDHRLDAIPPGQLARHGLLLRRPDEPHLRAGWDKVFGRTWREQDRVMPRLVPASRLAGRVGRMITNRNYTDNNWSGAAHGGIGTGGSWTTVVAIWNVPTVSQPSEPPGTESTGWQSVSWVGIDGYNGYSYDVLQVGVEHWVDLTGTPYYNAWVEWFVPPPDPSTLPPGTPVDMFGYPEAWVGTDGLYPYIYPYYLNELTLHAGDQVSCTAQYTSDNTAGTLTFANLTTGQYVPPITFAPPPGAGFNGNSAEWILEAPGGGEPGSSLPAFTPITFTWAAGCPASIAGAEPPFAVPGNSDTLQIAGNGKTLTSVTVDGGTCTISFTG